MNRSKSRKLLKKLIIPGLLILEHGIKLNSQTWGKLFNVRKIHIVI